MDTTSSGLDRRAGQARGVAATVFLGMVVAVAGYAVLSPGAQLATPFAGDVDPINEVWVLVSAALVFFMQAGFLAYEVGLSRPMHTTVVAMKNVVDWTISTLGFFVIGFGLMFGTSSMGIFGTDLVLLDGLASMPTTVSGGTFFLFQLAFAGTAITLVSGSLVERTTLLAYSIVAVVIAIVIYPIFGHWVWGNLLDPTNAAWLADLGFHDFAGGSVVHLLGATIAMVGLVKIGPRIGRFGPDGEVNDLRPSNVGMTVFGVLVLWLGWWGFNGGSHMVASGDVVATIIKTNLAAVTGLVGGGLYGYLLQGRYALNTKLVGGVIAGLVAITPAVDVVTPSGAIAIGLVAGVIYSVGHDALLARRVDDALGVIPAHGFAAVWGLLALAIFAPAGTFEGGALRQLGVQLVGVMACIAWAGIVSWVVYTLIERLIGLRVSPIEEMNGMEIETGSEMAPLARREVAREETPESDSRVAGSLWVG